MAKVITALLDLSVSRLAETMDVLRVTYTTRSGRPVKVLEMKQRRAVPADQKWRQMQMEALPTIGGLCREGRLSLCGSTELSLEAMKGTYRGGNVIGDLLGGVKLGPETHQLTREVGQPFGPGLAIASHQDEGLPFDIAKLQEPFPERFYCR
jgi:hypothetical protein